MKRQGKNSNQQGAVLLAVLLFVLVSTLATASLFEVHQTQRTREKEEQLIFVGNQFRRAIVSYASTLPQGNARALPQSLEDLLDDRRFVTPVHHLRRIYVDPMTGATDWRLVRTTQGIVGITSNSDAAPLKRWGGVTEPGFFANAQRYSDWIFQVDTSAFGLKTATSTPQPH